MLNIPHTTDQIERFIDSVGERKTGGRRGHHGIGGTTGDMEETSPSWAMRQVGRRKQARATCHTGALPACLREHKSKPTQHSVKELRGFGISPDIIVLRCDEPITDRSVFEKIAGLRGTARLRDRKRDSASACTRPLLCWAANFSGVVCRERTATPPPDMQEWREMVERIRRQSRSVTIRSGVGKICSAPTDAYLTVAEALRHTGYALTPGNIRWVDSEGLTGGLVHSQLDRLDRILVPRRF